jgi:hypothetical protein
MVTRKVFLNGSIIILVLSVLACTINIGGPEYPISTIPISTEAVGNLQTILETAVANGASSGEITLTFTESQLTTYLYIKLLTQSQPLISKPQVYLLDNQLQVYGTLSKSYFEATVRIVLSASVDEQGQLQLELSSADFGPLPVPNGLKEIITSAIKEAYTGVLGPVATGFRLQSVSITDGMMTIVGQTK